MMIVTKINKINKKNIVEILSMMQYIENIAYDNESYKYIIHINTFKELCGYCETKKITIIYDDTQKWYMLLGVYKNHIDIIDFASIGGVSKEILLNIIEYFNNIGIKKIECQARDTTSYKIIKKLDNSIWNIEKDISYDWDGELFHDIIITKNNI